VKVVITGSNGQLGRAFASVWPEAELWSRNELDLAASPDDIRKRVESAKADILINSAAYTAVDQAETHPELAHHINGTAVLAIANGCKRAATRLVHISTDYVFSDRPSTDESQLPDTERIQPVSVYGWSKLAGEQAARLAEDSLIVRTSWLYGDGQNFVQTMRKLGRKLPTVEVVSDQIGRPTYALDLAQAVKAVATQDVWPDTLNFQNSGTTVSWCEFAQAIFDEDGLDTKALPIFSKDYAAQKRATGHPYAERPQNSVFELDQPGLHHEDIRDWRLALKDYMTSVPAPE
jgi:dTDP-4-dehydrorhamnose reductase